MVRASMPSAAISCDHAATYQVFFRKPVPVFIAVSLAAVHPARVLFRRRTLEGFTRVMDAAPKVVRIRAGVYVGISPDAGNQISYPVLSRLVHQFVALAHAAQFSDVVDVLDVFAEYAFFSGDLPNVHTAVRQRRDTGGGASCQHRNNEHQ